VALDDRPRRARTGFVENLAALSNHYERAMVTFLDHNQFWKGATRFYHADTLPYWRKRKNLPHRLAAVDEASLRERRPDPDLLPKRTFGSCS
jgi:hypothetical protein